MAKKWTDLEKNALLAGVKEYGPSNFALIKKNPKYNSFLKQSAENMGADDVDDGAADLALILNRKSFQEVKGTYKSALYYDRGKGIWCRYNETFQQRLKRAFKNEESSFFETVSDNQRKLIDLLRMREYSLWKPDANFTPMCFVDKNDKIHFPGDMEVDDYCYVLKAEGEGHVATLVSLEKFLLEVRMMLEKDLEPDMKLMVGNLCTFYDNLGSGLSNKKKVFKKFVEDNVNKKFLTMMGNQF